MDGKSNMKLRQVKDFALGAIASFLLAGSMMAGFHYVPLLISEVKEDCFAFRDKFGQVHDAPDSCRRVK